MKKLCLLAIICLVVLNVYVPAGNADDAYTLRGDTISVTGETNVYLGIPGNGNFEDDSLAGVLSEGGDVWQNTMVIDFFVESCDDESCDDNCPVPQWQPLKLLSGQELDLVRWEDEWNPDKEYSYRWELKTLPKASGDSTYEISCIVGNETLSATMTIHCKEIELPTGLRLSNIDDTVHASVGETIVFYPEITPEGWNIPGYPQVRWGFDDEADQFADLVPVKDPFDNINERYRLTFKASGEYYSTYIISSDNISVGRTIAFFIDENPDWSFIFPAGIETIEESAFERTSAKAVYIPNGCRRICGKAFADSAVDVVFIPASVVEIGENAFPDGITIYTPERSYAYEWASQNDHEYRIVIKPE